MQSLTQHTNIATTWCVVVGWLTVAQLHMFAVFVSAVHAFLGVSVVDGGGETPGPFPNPEAKPARADGTAPGREWESRLPPTRKT